MIITAGTKIKCIKNVSNIINVNDVCEVTEIKDDMILFKFDGVHLGIMSIDEYDNHFRVVNKWSDWQNLVIKYYTFDGIRKLIYVEVRNNGKQVQIRKEINDGEYLKARSSCNVIDKFDYEKGFQIAKNRLLIKLMKKELEKLYE